MTYMVVTAYRIINLQAKVDIALAARWVLQGGIFQDHNGTWAQAMTNKEGK